MYNITRHFINALPGDKTAKYFPSSLPPVSHSVQRLDIKPTDHGTSSYASGWDEASKCQTKAALCPPKALASSGIIITYLAHGTLPLPFSMNHDSPLYKRSRVHFPSSHKGLLPA